MNNMHNPMIQSPVKQIIGFLKIKNLIVITILCILSFSCNKDDLTDVENQSLTNLIAEFNLKESNSTQPLFVFMSVEEASKFMLDLKTKQIKFKCQSEINIGSSELKSANLNAHQFTFKLKSKSLKRLKNGDIEHLTTEYDWSMFDDMNIDFDTNSSGSYIDGSANSYLSGTSWGTWAQTSTQMEDSNSFAIRGTMTYDISICGTTFTVTDIYVIHVDYDYSTRTANASWIVNP